MARTEESRAVTELQIPHGSLPSSSGFAPISPACEERVGEEVGREIDVKKDVRKEGRKDREKRLELSLALCTAPHLWSHTSGYRARNQVCLQGSPSGFSFGDAILPSRGMNCKYLWSARLLQL